MQLLGYQLYGSLLREAYNHHLFVSPSLTADNGNSGRMCPSPSSRPAAVGMPILSSRDCDIPKVVIHGSTGVLVEERDVDPLTVRLGEPLSHPETSLAMGAAARKHAESRFGLPQLAEALHEVYHRAST